uniref:Uncharacterized protein n=1 Tax=Anguilla anguilla TaxID=7936 RepID=A0A0E9UB41_ANGAN
MPKASIEGVFEFAC